MSKRKRKSSLSLIFSGISIILGLAAFCMLFLPFIGVKDSDATYTGLQIAFGYSQNIIGGIKIEVFQFAILVFLAFVFVLGGIVFSILGAVGKINKIFSFIAFALFIAAAILFFLSPSICVVNPDASSLTNFFGGNIKDSLILAWGAIVAAISAAVAGILQILKVISK